MKAIASRVKAGCRVRYDLFRSNKLIDDGFEQNCNGLLLVIGEVKVEVDDKVGEVAFAMLTHVINDCRTQDSLPSTGNPMNPERLA